MTHLLRQQRVRQKKGKVEIWRGGLGTAYLFSGPFVCRGLTSRPMLRFLRQEELALDGFLMLDDAVSLSHFAQCQDHGDQVLADLSQRFLGRRGFKPVSAQGLGDFGPRRSHQPYERIQDTLTQLGLDPRYCFRESAPIAQTYDYYHPERATEEQTATTSTLVERDDGIREISSLPGMERLKAVTGRVERQQFCYVPEEHWDSVRGIVEDAVRG